MLAAGVRGKGEHLPNEGGRWLWNHAWLWNRALPRGKLRRNQRSLEKIYLLLLRVSATIEWTNSPSGTPEARCRSIPSATLRIVISLVKPRKSQKERHTTSNFQLLLWILKDLDIELRRSAAPCLVQEGHP